MMQLDIVKSDLKKYLNDASELLNDCIIILDEETIERKDYWVFFYTNEKFLQTKDISDMIVGNSPIIINKITGEKYFTGTANPIEYYIEEYERANS